MSVRECCLKTENKEDIMEEERQLLKVRCPNPMCDNYIPLKTVSRGQAKFGCVTTKKVQVCAECEVCAKCGAKVSPFLSYDDSNIVTFLFTLPSQVIGND